MFTCRVSVIGAIYRNLATPGAECRNILSLEILRQPGEAVSKSGISGLWLSRDFMECREYAARKENRVLSGEVGWILVKKGMVEV